MSGLINPRIVRSALEVQRAHDILVSVLLMDPEDRAKVLGHDDANVGAVHAAADVLCWALGHAHNKAFEENLKGIEGTLMALGAEVYDVGQLLPGKEGPS